MVHFVFQKHPFVTLAQHNNLRQLVIMPFWAFAQLSRDAGDPSRDIDYIGIAMSARSGSTLLTQVNVELRLETLDLSTFSAP